MFSVVCVCLFTGGPHVTITHDTIGHVVTTHPTIQGPLPPYPSQTPAPVLSPYRDPDPALYTCSNLFNLNLTIQ